MADEIEQQEQEEVMEVGVGPSLAAEPAVAPPPSPLPPPPLPPPPLAPPSEAAAALPSDAASKRQRRPNVRLNEIGDSSLANVVEYFLKRKGGGDSKPTPPTTTAATAAPGKPSKKPKLSPKLKNDDVFHHAEDAKPRPSKPFEKRSLAPKSGSRKPGLTKSRYPDHSITVHSKHPRINRPRRYEGNGNSWMHKAMAGVADGFLEAADGGVYGCSDTDKHVRSRSPPHDFEVHPADSSFESDSPKGFRKIQAAKLKKKMGSGLKAPSAGYALKDEAEEKEEPSSSDVQELRLQGPVWERGVAPLDNKVRDWIQGIGLEKYASVFQHHEVENDVLPLLTMDDLKEMGISAVGARRKLFSEIMKLRQGLMLVDDPLSDEK